MSDLNITLVTIGGFTLVGGLVGGFLKSRPLPLSEPMLAVALGIVVGPTGLGLLRLDAWGEPRSILEQAARLTIGVSVMAVALRLPRDYFAHQRRTMALLLGPGMLLMWVASGLLVWWLLSLPFWLAMLIGAVVTPTDPVVSGTIVTGGTAKKNVPGRLRHAISAESGANDGGAYPFVFLAILMLLHPPSEALTTWLVRVLLWQVLAAVLLGYLLGFAAGHLQNWSRRRHFLEQTSLFTVTVALTVTVLAAVKGLGSDGILAAFTAGLGFNRAAGRPEEDEQSHVQEAVNRLLSFPVFVLFGMALPWEAWGRLGWTGVALALALLLLRRLPMLVLLGPWMAPLRSRLDVLFAGWFGPIGVAAVFYAVLASEKVGNDAVWWVGSLVVVASLLAHGATAAPFTLGYGRLARRGDDQEGDEA